MSKKIIDERPILLLPSLASDIGLNNAIFLQQLNYWCDIAQEMGYGVTHEGEVWIYKTAEEWRDKDFPFWSVVTIRRIIASLVEMDLIVTKQLSANKWDKTLFYRPNLSKWLDRSDQSDNVDVINLITSNLSSCAHVTENTTEITSKTNTESAPESLRNQFDIFWSAYPNKKDKKRAEQKFMKINFKNIPFEKLMDCLEAQKKTFDWTKNNGQFVPMASTWINGERWNDQIAEPIPGHTEQQSQFNGPEIDLGSYKSSRPNYLDM